jgi:hypothetical protein
MSEAYSVYWPRQRWRRATGVCQCLAVLFGGPHLSEPSFRRAAVQSGDLLSDRRLQSGPVRVRPDARPADRPGRRGPGTAAGIPRPVRCLGFLAPTCTTEVVIGAGGTGIMLDRPMPGEILQRLTYRPRRGPRPVRHVSDDGLLLHSISVQGIYRLAGSSAADLEAILAGPPGEPIPLYQSRKQQPVPAGTDTLF